MGMTSAVFNWSPSLMGPTWNPVRPPDVEKQVFVLESALFIAKTSLHGVIKSEELEMLALSVVTGTGKPVMGSMVVACPVSALISIGIC